MNNSTIDTSSYGRIANGFTGTQRRRIMSALRRAHRVLGVDRKNLRVGPFGLGGATTVRIAGVSLAAMVASMGLGSDEARATICQNSVGSTASGLYTLACGDNSKTNGDYTTAVGGNSNASSQGATAIGYNTQATALNTIALGLNAAASGTQAISVGYFASSGSSSSITMGVSTTTDANSISSSAFGHNAKITYARGGIAIGNNAAINGSSGNVSDGAMAIGTGATVSSGATDAIAQGSGAQAQSSESVAIGKSATAKGGKAVSIGSGNTANGNGAVAIGDPNTATGTGAVAVGANNTASGNGAVAQGNANIANGLSAVAIGNTATATGISAIAMGNQAAGSADYAISMGSSSNANGISTIAIGRAASASGVIDASGGVNSIALGTQANAYGNSGIAVGANAQAASNALAIGENSSAATNAATAVGEQAVATGSVAVALGFNAVATGSDSLAIGDTSLASQAGAISIGANSFANAAHSTAIGEGAFINALGTGATAIGYGAVATASDATAIGSAIANSSQAVAIGNGANANNANDVALGSGSVTATANPTSSATIGSTTYSGFAGTAPTSVVSVGSSGSERQITNVAAGSINSTSTDAINGSQLYSVANTLDAVATNTSTYLGGGADVKNGIAPSYSVGGTTYNNVGDVFSAIDSGAAGVVQRTSTQDVATMVASGGTAANPGNAQKLTNLSDGTVAAGSTDAVNGSQLYAVQQTANQGWNVQANGDTATQVKPGDTVQFKDGQNIKVTRSGGDVTIATADDLTATSITTGNAKLDTNGLAVYDGTNSTTYGANGFAITNGPSVLASGINAGGQKITNVADGSIASGSKDAVNGGQLFSTNQTIDTVASNTSSYLGAGADVKNGVAPSYTVQGGSYNNVGSAIGAVDSNLTTLNNSVTNGAVGVVQRTTTTDVATMTAAGGTAANPGTAQKLTNLAAGTLSASSSDAVNGSQLYATNQDVATNTSNITTNTTNIAALQGNALQWNPTLGAYDATHGSSTPQKIANVADGVATNDAVNKGQLDAVNATAGKGWNVTTAQTGTGTASGTSVANVAPGATQTVTAGNNIAIMQNGTDLTIATNPDLVSTSITTGNSKLDTNGLAITNGPSVLATGVDAGGQKITNVADGSIASGSKDAVNGGQLFATNQTIDTVASNTSSYLGAGADVKNGVAPNYTVQGGSYNNVGSAIGAVDSNLTTLNNSVNNGSVGVVQRTATADTTVLTASGGTAANPGNAQKLTNLAAGTLSASSTDAVNGSQLFATNQNVATNTTNIATNTTNIAALQGNALQWNSTLGAYDATHGSSTPQKIANVADGVATNDAVNKGQLDAVNATAGKGWNVQANGDTATQVKPGDTVQFKDGQNIKVTRSGTDITVATADDLVATSVTTGNSKLDTTGLTITNGPSVLASGIDAGDKTIANVADGSLASGSKDAVNGGQLFATNQTIDTVASNTSSYLGGGADVKNGVAPSYMVQGSSYNNVGSAIGAVDSSLTTLNNNVNNGSVGVVQRTATADTTVLTAAGGTAANPGNAQKLINLADGAVNAGSKEAVNGGQLYGVSNSVASVIGGSTVNSDGTITGPTNIGGTGQSTVNDAIASVSATAGKGFNVQANGDTATQVKPGDTVQLKDGQNIKVTRNGTDITVATADDLTATSITTGNAKLDTNGLAITNGPSVLASGIDAGGKTITNVAAGDISSASSTDAVNGGQLFATNQNVSNLTNNVDNGSVGVVQRAATADTTVLTALGGTAANPGNAQKLTNLADGLVASGSTEAVNGGQLFGVSSSVASVIGGSTVNSDGTITGPTDIGGTGKNNINDAIAEVNTTVGKGWNLTAQGVNSSAVKPGDTVDLANDDGNIKVKKTAAGNAVTFDLADDVAVKGSVSVDDGSGNKSKLSTGGLNVADASGNTGIYGSNGFSLFGPGSVAGPSITNTYFSAGGLVIQNVAAGAVNATSTDAVNGSQLYGVSNSVANVIGGGSTVNPDGTIAGPADIGGTGKSNVSDAIASVNATASNANKGWNVSTNGGTASNVAPGATVDIANTDGNVVLNNNGTNVKVDLAKNVTVDSVTAGNSKLDTNGLAVADGSGKTTTVGTGGVAVTDGTNTTTVGADGVRIAGGPSMTKSGIDAGGQKVANVAAGDVSASSTDAVNGSQLYAVQQMASAGWNISTNGGASTNVAPGKTVDFSSGSSNVVLSNTGTNVTVDLAKNVSVDSVTAGNSKLDTNGLTIAGGPSVTSSGINAGGQKIASVGAATLSATSTDAVNGSQLWSTNQDVAALSQNAVKYDTDGNGKKTNKITLQGSDPNAPVLITNVAAGVADTDAVNVKQMKTSSATTLASANSYTDNRTAYAISTANSYTDTKSAQTLSAANAYTDQKFGALSSSIGDVRNEARQAAAIGLAAASLRYDDRPGKLSAAIGGGVWRGQGAAAFGLGYTNEDQTVRANVSATTAGGQWGVGAGLSFTLN